MSTFSQIDRLNFRIKTKSKELIEHAAAIKGQSLTDFAVSVLTREAQEIVQSDSVLVLSNRDRDRFLRALDNPPRPAKRALAAAARYKALNAKP